MTRYDGDSMGGKGALVLAAAIYLALAVLAYAAAPVADVPAPMAGICLPSPQEWDLPPQVSIALNAAVTVLAAVWLIGINRRFNFIPSTSVLYASVFLLMAGANPRLAVALNSSTLLLLANVVSIGLLFNQYGRQRVNPAAIFVVGTMFSLGSMLHYSFIFFIGVYACSAALLKTFTLRELVALVIGTVAPYWILLGSGIICLSDIRLPVPGAVWQASVPAPEMFWLILSAAVTALWGLMAGLANAFSLFSASTSIRAFNSALTLPALACGLLLLVDWENFMVYFLPLSLFTAIEAGYLCNTGRRGAGAAVYWCVAAVYVFLALMSIYNE